MQNTFSKLMLLILLTSVGCKPMGMMIAKKTGEFIEPQKETPASIMSYCDQLELNYDQLHMLKSDNHFNPFIKKYKDIPGIYVFDKKKQIITPVTKSYCPWTMISYVYDTTIQTQTVQDISMFSEIISNFNRIHDKANSNEADYYILCTWAKFIPKGTKALFETVNKQKMGNKPNVSYLLLNLDLQDYWDIE